MKETRDCLANKLREIISAWVGCLASASRQPSAEMMPDTGLDLSTSQLTELRRLLRMRITISREPRPPESLVYTAKILRYG